MAKKSFALLDTRVIDSGDNLDGVWSDGVPPSCDGGTTSLHSAPPFNSNRNYEVFWGETKEKRAFEDSLRCVIREGE